MGQNRIVEEDPNGTQHRFTGISKADIGMTEVHMDADQLRAEIARAMSLLDTARGYLMDEASAASRNLAVVRTLDGSRDQKAGMLIFVDHQIQVGISTVDDALYTLRAHLQDLQRRLAETEPARPPSESAF